MEDQYKDLIDNLDAGVYFVDRSRNITYWNKAAERITGFPADAVIGRSCSANILRHIDAGGTDLCESACPLVETITEGNPHVAEVYLHHRDGHRVPVSVRASPIRDKEGQVIGAVELFTDNSSKDAIMDKVRDLEQLALLDPLTRMGNRRSIEMHLTGRLNELMRYDYPFGVIMMDIDHFKKFNDTYGHDTGDRVLVMVANTLMNNSRPSDDYGRWGGEEFIGVLRNVDEQGMMGVAERVRILVKKSFLTVGDEKLQVTMSIGGALARKDDSMESVVKRADEQLYRSKREGRDRVSIHAGAGD